MPTVKMSQAEFVQWQFLRATAQRIRREFGTVERSSCTSCLLLNCVFRCTDTHHICAAWMGRDELHMPEELAAADAESRHMPWEQEFE